MLWVSGLSIYYFYNAEWTNFTQFHQEDIDIFNWSHICRLLAQDIHLTLFSQIFIS